MTREEAAVLAKRLLEEMRSEAEKTRPTGEQPLRAYPWHGFKSEEDLYDENQ